MDAQRVAVAALPALAAAQAQADRYGLDELRYDSGSPPGGGGLLEGLLVYAIMLFGLPAAIVWWVEHPPWARAMAAFAVFTVIALWLDYG